MKRGRRQKKSKRPRSGKRKTSGKAKAPVPGRRIGTVTHYFSNLAVGVIKVVKGPLQNGDRIRIKGHTTDFKQEVKSMQINRIPIDSARSGEEIGMRLKKRVRQGDEVYRLD